jgi:hypothetical protein
VGVDVHGGLLADGRHASKSGPGLRMILGKRII